MRNGPLVLVAVLGLSLAAPAVAGAAPWLDARQSPDRRAAELVAAMTLDEKISQLHLQPDAEHQRFVPPIPRLGVPGFRIANGPAGMGPADDKPQKPATALPATMALASTFDTDVARKYGRLVGAETRALAHNVSEGPDINIARVPRNGRTFEGMGEDPFLVGALGAADIRGIQENGTIAEVKHYAANNQETQRQSIDEHIDERTLNELYLPHFEQAVTEGHAGSVMCAYPKINGVFTCENPALLQDKLRDDWGFEGFVQSDWGAAHSTVGSANAGMNLEMIDGTWYGEKMKQAVLAGQVSEQRVDELLLPRFRTMFAFGQFDHPPVLTPLPTARHDAAAKDFAERGMVLLRNEHAQLPLSSAVRSIALIGPFATKAKTGGGGSSAVIPTSTVDPLPGLRARVPGAAVTLDDGSDPARAAALAAGAEVAVVMVGDNETEGKDRPSLALEGNQDALVAAVAAANPHTVVVVKSGGPVLMPWAASVPSILQAWYPGQQDGAAVAGVLFGDVNPSAKLPITFPAADADTPANTAAQFPGVNGVAEYSEGLQVGYRWFDAQGRAPLFPFGHGLSYTTFAFSGLSVRTTGDGATATFTVRNTGHRAGAEVAQLYLGFPSAAGEPPRQLKGFSRVSLAPGQSQRVTIRLAARDFSVWDTGRHAWTPVKGGFTVQVGDSSRSLPLQAPLKR
ncbi:glycoside hydrolase family 3 C-terminal domain-containing protein [Amycolatopsis sp. OK19-0408]|uniref:Glycoside hydrolase family 3 C-terminal domain-containing protein n=1 Tax=Amycolatopsis iheyensis TaxID=2945988 RepID=A0A9X2SNZ1_9PSEU|nr:glycoside hydrolase family 3 C-terminal domain-containing protein [Amycolatopsis iheyensis]MCR6488483.1 glycoside hydrolase family 3 C-terminal domain-containing protein [Amycolatopsis iheyensis]